MKKYAIARKVKHTIREDARCPLCGHRWQDCHCTPEVLDEYVEHTVAETTAREAKRRQRMAKVSRLATRRACDRARRDHQLLGEQQVADAGVVATEGYDVLLSGITLDEEDVYERDAAMAHA